MPRRHPREARPEEKLRQCERWTTNVSWPAPIDQRLTRLVQVAVDAGEAESLSRSELLAALVLHAPKSGAKLRGILDRFRRAPAKEALVRDDDLRDDVIILEERRPGRRSATRS